LGEDHPLAAYRLKDWPFREVPEPTRCTFIAGRPKLQQTLDRLVAGTGNPVSSIFLFWASLGAGKTHALYYLMNQMNVPELFLPIYSEYPESPAGFVEIYERFARNIDWDGVADACFALFVEADGETAKGLNQIKLVQPDIYRSFFLLAEGEDKGKSQLARRWLRGEELSRGELRDTGLAQNLHSAGDCASAISVLAKLLGLKQRMAAQTRAPFRLVWVIDECQRLQNTSARVNQEVNAALQSTFNATPDHLTIILSFTGKPEKKFPAWLKPELADRIGAKNVILLPPLSKDEARKFLADLLAHYHSKAQGKDALFPFSDDAVEYLLKRLMKGDLNAFGLGSLVEQEGIRPRALIKCCQAMLEEHIEQKAAVPIDEKFAASVLPK
jgi:hypothetical protein